ncbi:unnamed protein product [Ectocarpus sp. 12 AP-2014]
MLKTADCCARQRLVSRKMGLLYRGRGVGRHGSCQGHAYTRKKTAAGTSAPGEKPGGSYNLRRQVLLFMHPFLVPRAAAASAKSASPAWTLGRAVLPCGLPSPNATEYSRYYTTLSPQSGLPLHIPRHMYARAATEYFFYHFSV